MRDRTAARTRAHGAPRSHPRTRRYGAVRATAALVTALAVLPALAACESGSEDRPKAAAGSAGPSVVAPGRPGEEARTLSPEQARGRTGGDTKPNAADFRYATMMIEHHRQAVVMTDLADGRAGSAGVRKLASRIGAAQGPEIKAMSGWLKQHKQHKQHRETAPKDTGAGHGGHGGGGGGERGEHDGGGGGHGDHASMPGMATGAQLARLRAASGAAFDQLFLTLMTAHHRGAVTMGAQLVKDGNDVRVEEMATDVMAQQNAEIERMRKLGG